LYLGSVYKILGKMIDVGKFYEKYSKQYISSMKNNYVALCYRHIHLNFLIEIMNKISSKYLRILDLGCGPCFDLKFLVDSLRKIDITGVDLTKSFIEHCENLLPEGKFFNTDIMEFLQNTSQTWDIIISNFGVINHFPPTEIRNFFELVSSRLSEDGFLFVSFLNKLPLNEIIYFLLRFNFKNLFRRFYINQKGFNDEEIYVYFYTINYIKSVTKKLDIELYKLRGVGWIIPPPYTKVNKRLIKFLCFIEKQFTLPLIAYISDFSIIVFRKKGGMK